jgi:hypothetical protein
MVRLQPGFREVIRAGAIETSLVMERAMGIEPIAIHDEPVEFTYPSRRTRC